MLFSKDSVQWFFPVSEKVDVSAALSGGMLQERDPLICRVYYLGSMSAYADPRGHSSSGRLYLSR